MRRAAGFRRSISTARKPVSKYFSVRTPSVATAGRAGSPARVTATTDGAPRRGAADCSLTPQ